jgi:hypothetical protein
MPAASGQNINIEVNRFDIAGMTSNGKCPTICFFGKRGSGKSVLMREILYYYHLANVPRACVFSATESLNSFFGGFIAPICIHSPVSVSAITKVFEDQKELKMKKEMGLISKDVDIRLILVLDDLAFDKAVLKSKVLSEICLNGRHSEIILLLSIQYLMDLTVGCRSNIDYALLMADNNADNQKRIHTAFASGFQFRTFQVTFEQCTKDHECFVLPAKSCGPKPEDSAFFYKADINLNFKFGAPEVWEYSQQRYFSPMDQFRQKLEQQAALKATKPKPDKKVKKTRETVHPKAKKADTIITVTKS